MSSEDKNFNDIPDNDESIHVDNDKNGNGIYDYEEEKVQTSDGKTEIIWDYFYDAFRFNKPYPITSAQAIETVRTIEAAKIGTEFAK